MCVLLQARLDMRKSSWQVDLSCQPRGVWRFHLFRSHNATKRACCCSVLIRQAAARLVLFWQQQRG